MSQSHTVVAGDQLELECRVWGWPVPRVTWQRLRTPLDFDADHRLRLMAAVAAAPKGYIVDNATLIIADVTFSDRDLYTCEVTSYVNGSLRTDNSSVLVRVKGEHWPTLSVCIAPIVAGGI